MIRFFSLVALAGILSACHKDSSCEGCGPLRQENATVVWTGPVSGDGCDWTIVDSDGHHYHPDHLPELFKQDQKAVKIRFRETAEQWHCGLAATGLKVIDIISIQ